MSTNNQSETTILFQAWYNLCYLYRSANTFFLVWTNHSIFFFLLPLIIILPIPAHDFTKQLELSLQYIYILQLLHINILSIIFNSTYYLLNIKKTNISFLVSTPVLYTQLWPQHKFCITQWHSNPPRATNHHIRVQHGDKSSNGIITNSINININISNNNNRILSAQLHPI